MVAAADKARSVLAIHMGEAFDRLNPLLQQAHLGRNRLHGTVSVKRGNALARLICTVFHFPQENPATTLTVECDHTADGMIWQRSFDGHPMQSHFRRQGHYLIESLSPLDMAFKAEEVSGNLHYRFVHTKLWGIPMPNFLSPQVVAYEEESDGNYRFSVTVRMFLVGIVIAYGGALDLTSIQSN